MTAAPVNKIIPLSTVDGPGARTAIFLQGCNIACAYCHNPETQQMCNGCGLCVAGCPAGALRKEGGAVLWDEALCAGCDECIKGCPHYATPKVRRMTPAAVMDEVRRNLPFVRGLTVSGGECTLYPQFLTGLFTLAKAEGLSCLIDSNGATDFSQCPDMMAVCDGVMLDVKAWDPATYCRLTGSGGNGTVKANLDFLSERGLLAEVRVVCLPGHVDAEAVIDGVGETLGPRAAAIRLKLIAFRNLGVRGALAQTASPPQGCLAALADRARENGFGQIVVV